MEIVSVAEVTVHFVGKDLLYRKTMQSEANNYHDISLNLSSLQRSLFAHGCDVTSMSLVGSPMALAHSLTRF